ncbi:MAG TPA: tRNA epoxyqueuosine(34) reductase QueG [Anaerolineales bacterium]|nr:tRNA epoxyqueuosine(34) reductase QueG [Anaerolineales bacterium]
MTTLPARLQARARELGFAFCGLTTPDPPSHIAEYEAWLAKGYHGEMTYLASERARQRRADPRLIFPGCKTIIVVALPYAPGDTAGPIAAYALGNDYHDIIPRKIDELVAWLESEVGRPIERKVYTDTGPLLERELAQRAGIGWIGKNTMLINPKAGSCFLPGEVLIDLELPPDPPFTADHCGTCTRCIEACPTDAILPDRVLDARRCISYLTIELKGSIPEDLREPMGGWIFGCDICQAVCPWNARFAQSLTPDPAFAPRHPNPDTSTLPPSGVAVHSLIAELSLTPEQFNTKFKGSPITRAKRRGYLRNVAVALGNEGNADAIPALEQCVATENEPLVREHAAWALSRVKRDA